MHEHTAAEVIYDMGVNVNMKLLLNVKTLKHGLIQLYRPFF